MYWLIFLGGSLNNSEWFIVNQVESYNVVRNSKPCYWHEFQTQLIKLEQVLHNPNDPFGLRERKRGSRVKWSKNKLILGQFHSILPYFDPNRAQVSFAWHLPSWVRQVLQSPKQKYVTKVTKHKKKISKNPKPTNMIKETQ